MEEKPTGFSLKPRSALSVPLTKGCVWGISSPHVSTPQPPSCHWAGWVRGPEWQPDSRAPETCLLLTHSQEFIKQHFVPSTLQVSGLPRQTAAQWSQNPFPFLPVEIYLLLLPYECEILIQGQGPALPSSGPPDGDAQTISQAAHASCSCFP